MTLAELIREAEVRLAAAGVESAGVNARILAEHAFALAPLQIRRRGDLVPAPEQTAHFQDLLARRLAREPLQRIIGRWEFWGLDLALGPETLIPRADTETVVEAVLKRRPDRRTPWRILDLGTGTGAILLALLHEYPAATGIGVDVSPGAARIAAGNAAGLGLGPRAAFLVGNWADALGSNNSAFDIVVSNPPYIPDGEIDQLAPEVAHHEPRRALAGGADGLDPYRRLAGEARRLLVPGGLLALEHGADQGPAVAALLAGAGLIGVETVADLSGLPRVTCAVRAG
ncbi:MAG: hypothetical protein RLY86_2358 [Pseudomonadota bacterium]|jgi:release factor glutamine methyltransferase